MELSAQVGVRTILQPSGRTTREDHLLIVLHGRGDTAEGFAWLQGKLGLPGLSALLLDAPDPYDEGRCWYTPPDRRPGIDRSRALLTKVFDEVFRAGYAPEHCFLFGFSQGALMTLEFGAREARRLAGYVAVSGRCHDAEALLKEARPEALKADWLVTHGKFDEVLPIETTRAQMKMLSDGGFAVDYRESPKKHTIDPGTELPEIRDWLKERMRP